MKKILFTGASGFLGSNIIHRIIGRYDVAAIVRNATSYQRLQSVLPRISTYNIDELPLEQIIREAAPEVIVHCATDYGRKNVSPFQVIEANLILPLKILYYARMYGVKTFINTDTFLDKGINHYSLSKKQFRDWLQTYSDSMVCINMVLEHFYGPFDDKTKFVSYLIHELLSGRDHIDLTPGEQKRNFIYIDDVVAAFDCVLQHDFSTAAGCFDFFIGSEETISIKELALLLRRLSGASGTELNFGAVPYRSNEAMDSSVDISAIKALGWRPQTSLLDGITQTIQLEKQLHL